MGERRGRIFLEIVRRQHHVGRRDEGLEEAEGPAGGEPQRQGVRRRLTGSLPSITGDRLAQRASAGNGLPGPGERPSGDRGGRLANAASAGEASQAR